MSRFILVIVAIILGAVLFTERIHIQDFVRELRAPDLPEAVEYKEVAVSQSKPVVDPIETLPFASGENPKELDLAVPFTSQAPNGDWKLPFKEACEEASVLMVAEFYAGAMEGKMDADDATKKINELVRLQNNLFGFYEDTTVVQTAEFAKKKYGYQSRLIENPTVDDIKKELAGGNPVIVPLAGRELHNPFYTPPGPIYHMLVIRGYTADGKFITNDPGTKHGEAYLYPFDTLMNAIHDWNSSGDILEGKRVVLVLNPER